VSGSPNGIVRIASRHSVDATIERLQSVLAEKGIKLFAVVDHSGEATRAGLAMRPTKLAIFGNPKAGTPLMVARPSVALDLPLKILVAEDEAGHVWVSYNAPDYLGRRHDLPDALLPNISAVVQLAAAIAE
jgi:uncharacterized protein (DUF302 family)